MKQTSQSGAVFLDRDGVINKLIYHKEAGIVDSPLTLRQFQLLPRVPDAIKILNGLGLPVVVVSNQPGIAKKKFTAATLRTFDRHLNDALERAGGHLDGVYYCTHHPESLVPSLRRRCQCRKPGVGMLKRAAKDFDIALSESFMVGDGLTDIEAGHKAGCQTIFVGKWKCECCSFIEPKGLRPSFVARDLWGAARLIKSIVESRRMGSALSHTDGCCVTTQ